MEHYTDVKKELSGMTNGTLVTTSRSKDVLKRRRVGNYRITRREVEKALNTLEEMGNIIWDRLEKYHGKLKFMSLERDLETGGYLFYWEFND